MKWLLVLCMLVLLLLALPAMALADTSDGDSIQQLDLDADVGISASETPIVLHNTVHVRTALKPGVDVPVNRLTDMPECLNVAEQTNMSTVDLSAANRFIYYNETPLRLTNHTYKTNRTWTRILV